MANTTKQKNTYAVNFYGTREDYEAGNATVLGYVNSVSQRGAEMMAKKTLTYPRNGWIIFENLTQKARKEAQERARQEEKNNRRLASGLTTEELQQLEDTFRAEETSRDKNKLENNLSKLDRAISDATHRKAWDNLAEDYPELESAYDSFLEQLESLRPVLVSQLRAELESFSQLAQRCAEVGILDDEVAGWHARALVRLDNKENERND